MGSDLVSASTHPHHLVMKKTSALFTGLALALGLSISAQAQFGWATTTANELVHFNLSSPSNLIHSATITGLRQSDGTTADPFGNILDLAQFNGQLYGIDGNANFYSINGLSGAATFINNQLAPLGFDAGLAYDPFTGKFRFLTDAGESLQLALDGSVSTGDALFFAPGDAQFGAQPAFIALGIDADFGTGYAIDAATDTVSFTFDPNFAEFFTLGSLGIDATGLGSLDLLDSALYAALSTDSSLSSLYRIDATTGAASLIGDFNTGITGFVATSFTPVPEPSTYGLFGAAFVIGLVALRRRRAA